MDRHRVARVRCVATEACRRARNGPDFIRLARRVAGIDLEVLGHDEEARLAMLGCLPLIDPAADRLLMLDIGGGSTEIMWLDRREPADGREPWPHPVDAAGRRHPVGDASAGATDESAYDRMVRLTRSSSWPRPSGCRPRPASQNGPRLQMLGTSGTVTTLAAVHLGLRRYDRRKVDGLSLPFSVIQSVSRMLRELDDAGRAAHPCIGLDRADLVVAGCAILDAVHRCWPVERLQVADRGLREGILNALMGQSLGPGLAARADAFA